MIGTIIPAGLLILLGIIYISTGGHNHMDMSQGFFPDLSKFDNLVLASSIFLFYAGMEMMGIHVMDVKNPSRNYPKAIIIGSLVTVCIFVLGTFSLGFIIPAKDISLTQSLLVGFDNYFHYLHMSWAGPIIAIALMFGVLAGVLTWVAGPSKGIFAVGKAGYLPPVLPEDQQERRTEEYPAHSGLRRDAAGAAVRGDALGAVVLPDTFRSSTVPLYLIMYMLMFSAAIVLRYKMKNTDRPFRLGKGNGLMWFLGCLGTCGALLAFVLSFVPPSQISTGSNTVWFSVLIIGCVVGSRGRPVRDLRHAQTVVERPRGRGRLRPVPLGAAARRSGSGTYQRSPNRWRNLRIRNFTTNKSVNTSDNDPENRQRNGSRGRTAGLRALQERNGRQERRLYPLPGQRTVDPLRHRGLPARRGGDRRGRHRLQIRHRIGIEKVPTAILAMNQYSAQEVLTKIGADATGLPFNSIMAILLENDHPSTPLVNAGAISACSMVQPVGDSDGKWKAITGFIEGLAGSQVEVIDELYKSETATNFNNKSIAWLLKITTASTTTRTWRWTSTRASVRSA